MSRHRFPYTLIKPENSRYFYFKLGTWKSYKSTGTSVIKEAEEIARDAYVKSLMTAVGPTLRNYAEPYFVWERCPHVQRLLAEGKSITRNHVKNNRSLLIHHIFPDPISQIRLTELKRADVLDFRTRLVAKKGYTRTVQRAMSALKVILKEAFFREDIERDPAAGVGTTKYEAKDVGVFTEDELRKLFPPQIPGPWASLLAYGVFLTAAVTGMRRGEILALQWQQFLFGRSSIVVEKAWKDRNELGKPKWNKTRVTPLPDSLITALMLVRGMRGDVYADDLVFSYLDRRRLGGTWWQKNFRRGLDHAGIDYEKRHLTAHSFRHTLNSLLRERGYDAAKIRASMGWSSRDVQDGYTHWNDSSFIEHREIVDRVFR